MKKIAVSILLFVFLIGSCIMVSANNRLISSKEVYPSDYGKMEVNIYYPDLKGKLPVVFLAHNGGQNGTAWGDFPQQIANAGFFTVNITYSDNSDVESAIDYVLKKYSDKIDIKNVSFVGGCHGARIFTSILSEGNMAYTLKSLVFLSLSENDPVTLGGKHPPILAYYSLNDELGDSYTAISKEIATNSISSPKKVVSNSDRSHGDNMVVNASNKEQIRKDIINWLKNPAVSQTALKQSQSKAIRISSSKYRIDNNKGTIAIGEKSILLSTFKNNIKAVIGATVTVIKSDEKTPITKGNVSAGMKLKVLLKDGKTYRIYTIIK